MFFYVIIVLVNITIYTSGNTCPAGRFGDDCALTCHCPSSLVCDNRTGQCGGGNRCAKSYSTPNNRKPYCQRADIAYMKDTSASSSNYPTTWLPENVVDDDILSSDPSVLTEGRTCYWSATRDRHWLQVDLGKVHIFKWMRLRRRWDCCAFSMNKFGIYVSNTTMTNAVNLPTNGFTECYQHPGGVQKTFGRHRKTPAHLRYVHIECRSTPYIAARYVIVYVIPINAGDNTTHFCQLNVYECSHGTYGQACDKLCNCMNINEVCNPVTGACGSGCRRGYTGPACQKSCPFATFGESCRKSCHCVSNSQCNIETGSCEGFGNGCSDGWRSFPGGSSCQIACASGTYGQNCKLSCQCARSGCDRFTGSCASYGGCKAGRRNSQRRRDCQLPCQDGMFGIDCLNTCNCFNADEVCSRVSGQCMSGCAVGYQFTDCLTRCSSGWYGRECNRRCGACQPSTSPCNHTTGHCSKCTIGMTPPLCQHPCSGTFGDQCTKTCRCHVNSQCNAVTGVCESDGCAAGWMSAGDVQNCQTECLDGKFGRNCNFSCACSKEEEICNKINGECASGCRAGRMGIGCQQPCPDRKFGLGCNTDCNCNDPNEVCNKVTGNCTSGCRDGKIAPSCLTNCPDGSYGRPRCSQNCRCESKENQCDSVTGHCLHGVPCKIGYIGRDCQTKCSGGMWYRNCTKECHCADKQQCHHALGNCTDDKCAAGYRLKNCSEKCATGKYGIDCSEICACNNRKEVCLFDSGDCPISGRFENNNREETTKSSNYHTGVPSYVVGVIVACLCVVFIAVIVIVVVYFRKRLSNIQRPSEYLEPQLNYKNDGEFEMSEAPAPPPVDDGYEDFTSTNDPKLYTELQSPYIEVISTNKPESLYINA